jgi:hypothetical protein
VGFVGLTRGKVSREVISVTFGLGVGRAAWCNQRGASRCESEDGCETAVGMGRDGALRGFESKRGGRADICSMCGGFA